MTDYSAVRSVCTSVCIFGFEASYSWYFFSCVTSYIVFEILLRPKMKDKSPFLLRVP